LKDTIVKEVTVDPVCMQQEIERIDINPVKLPAPIIIEKKPEIIAV
jgi:hypothetical protein